jgi:uncharacterized membrane protein (UPF0136 family)
MNRRKTITESPNFAEKTPSQDKSQLILRLLSGASLCFFIVTFIGCLIGYVQNGSQNSSDLPVLIGAIFPAVFALLLLIKGKKMPKGVAFAMAVVGIAIWAVVFLAIALILGIFAGLTNTACSASSSSISSSLVSSTSSAGGATCNAFAKIFENFFYSGLVFLLFLLIHEIFLGIASFSKKNWGIPLFIASGVLTISSIVFAIATFALLESSGLYILMGILGSDALSFALSDLLAFGAKEKAPRDNQGA